MEPTDDRDVQRRTGAPGPGLADAILDNVPAVVYVQTDDDAPTVFFLSGGGASVYGRTAAALAATPDLRFRAIHGEDRPAFDALWTRARAAGGAFRATYRILRGDGSIAWVRDEAARTTDATSGAAIWVGVLLDVTEHRETESALRDVLERYRTLVERVPAVIYRAAPDDNRRVLFVNEQVEQLLGYTREEWLDQPDIWMELLHPEDREPTLAEMDRCNESGDPFDREYRLIASDGRPVWFRDSAHLVRDPNGSPLYWEGIQVDVSARHSEIEDLRIVAFLLEEQVAERTAELTEANQLLTLEVEERRSAEASLERSRAEWRRLVEELPLVVFTWDLETNRATYVSPRMLDLFGYDAAVAIAADASFWNEKMDARDREAVVPPMRAALAAGEPYDVRYRFRCADGRTAWVRERITPLRLRPDGSTSIYLGFMTDVTEPVLRELALSDAEERFRTLTAGVPAWLYSWTVVDGVALGGFTSPQAATDFGYDDALGNRLGEAYWRQFVHPDDVDRVYRGMARCAENGDPFEDTYRWILPDGRTVWMLDRARATRWDPERREGEFHGVMVDVTDLVERRVSRGG